VREAYLNDIEKDAIEYATHDLELPKITNSATKTTTITTPFHCKKTEKNGITFFQGDGLDVLKHFFIPKRLDLLVCNPPYIPSSTKEKDLDETSPNFWEGTRLLRYLLKNYSTYADHLVMIISSLSFINEYVIHELNNVNFKVLEQHTVPVKVYHDGKNILEDDKMLKLLHSDKKQVTIHGKTFDVGLIDDPNDLWKYKHTIYFVHAHI
jgi:tRNA1(Val) A37 N6-methylase TrmN6